MLRFRISYYAKSGSHIVGDDFLLGELNQAIEEAVKKDGAKEIKVEVSP